MTRPAAAAPPRRPAALAWLALGLLALGALAFWGWQRQREVVPPLSLAAAEMQTRRAEVTLGDIQATWTRLLTLDGRVYWPVEHRFFVRATPSPCAGVHTATGPFYCDRDRVLYIDLGFFAALTPQLQAIEETGGKLIIANLAAAALQDQLGIRAAVAARWRTASGRQRAAMELALALQADCLTGVWARDSATRLGVVPVGLYERAVQGTRRIVESQASWDRAAPRVLNALGLGDKADREAAFGRGYGAGTLGACRSPDPANPEQ